MAPTNTPWLARFLRAIDAHFWLRHGLFWLVRLGLLMVLFRLVLHCTPTWTLALRDNLLLLAPHMLVVYTLLYGLLPLLGQPRRQALLAGGLALWFVLSLGVTFAFRYYVLVPLHVDVPSPLADSHQAFVLGPHMPLLLTAGVAVVLHLYRRWQRQALANEQLIRGNFQAELQLLKAQVHPHFLFNTLNNLYALTLRQSDQAPVVVERLAGLLDFVVRHGQAPTVSLAQEVALLRNYLALEQLRYGSRLTLDFMAEGLPATGQLAPLLLLPLVENAFKHGAAEQLGAAHIRISLAMHGSEFSCLIENSTAPEALPAAGPRGIGLHNVRQRLALLYPGQHELAIEARPGTFVVRLTLRLPALVAPAAGPAGTVAAGVGSSRPRRAAAEAWVSAPLAASHP